LWDGRAFSGSARSRVGENIIPGVNFVSAFAPRAPGSRAPMNEQQAQPPSHADALDFCRRSLRYRRCVDAPAWSGRDSLRTMKGIGQSRGECSIEET
jgi:hypothetical protein